MSMEFNLCNKFQDVEIDASDWNHLLKKSPTNSIFQTFEWFQCWWTSCGSAYQLALITGTENGSLCLIAPFMINIEYKTKRILRFVADVNSDYCDIIYDRTHTEAPVLMFEWLLKAPPIYDAIILKNIPSESSTSSIIDEVMDKNDHSVIKHVQSTAPTLMFNNNEHNVTKIINKYSVKRHANKLKRTGDVSFKILQLDDSRKLKFYLEDFFKQHISRFTEKDNDSLFIRQMYTSFYTNLIESLADKNWIHFSVLEFNNIPIAYHFGFIYNKRFIWYKPSFNVNYSHLSPGSVLLGYLIKFALVHGYDEFDFTIGNELYKKRFCNKVRTNENLFIYRSRRHYYLQLLRRKFSLGQKYLTELFRPTSRQL